MANKCTVWIKLEYLPCVFLGLKTETTSGTLPYWAFLSIWILQNKGRDCMQHASRITITCRIQATSVASVQASQAKSCQAGQWRIAHPHLLEIFKYGAPPYISAIKANICTDTHQILRPHFLCHSNSNTAECHEHGLPTMNLKWCVQDTHHNQCNAKLHLKTPLQASQRHYSEIFLWRTEYNINLDCTLCSNCRYCNSNGTLSFNGCILHYCKGTSCPAASVYIFYTNTIISELKSGPETMVVFKSIRGK